MRGLRQLVVLAGALALASSACSDATAPATAPSPASATIAPSVSLAKQATLPTASTAPLAPAAPVLLQFLPGAPPLSTYDTTFAAVQGKPARFTLFFAATPQAPAGDRFMTLSVPNSAQFVGADGLPLPDGAAVPLTVHVDRQNVSFEFGPHGSQFSTRAVTVRVYLANTTLATGSASAPLVFYQPDAVTPWSTQPNVADMKNKYVEFSLSHFSNYRIAY